MSHVRTVAAATALVLATLLGACGDDDTAADEATTTTTPEAEESTTTTEADETTTTTGDDDGGVTTTTDLAAFDAWHATALDTRDEPAGSRFDYVCPPDGSPSNRVWGTDIYTDDSSVCTAAVHAGVITVEDGGTVTIELRGPQDSFEASTRFGIVSFEYPEWPGSFSVVAADG